MLRSVELSAMKGLANCKYLFIIIISMMITLIRDERVQVAITSFVNYQFKSQNGKRTLDIGNQPFIQLKDFAINSFAIRYLISKFIMNIICQNSVRNGDVWFICYGVKY